MSKRRQKTQGDNQKEERASNKTNGSNKKIKKQDKKPVVQTLQGKSTRNLALKSVRQRFSTISAQDLNRSHQKINKLSITEVLSRKQLEQYLTCSICLSSLQIPVDLSCGHTFCLKCLQQWQRVNSNCPNCRDSQVTPYLQPNPTMNKCIKVFLHNYAKSEQRSEFDNTIKIIHDQYKQQKRQLEKSILHVGMGVHIRFAQKWKRGVIQSINTKNNKQILGIRIGCAYSKKSSLIYTHSDSYLLRHLPGQDMRPRKRPINLNPEPVISNPIQRQDPVEHHDQVEQNDPIQQQDPVEHHDPIQRQVSVEHYDQIEQNNQDNQEEESVELGFHILSPISDIPLPLRTLEEVDSFDLGNYRDMDVLFDIPSFEYL